MEEFPKRKAEEGLESDGKRAKTKRQWRVPRKGDGAPAQSIQPGDSGIWVTCVKGKEGKCVWEVLDLFESYATTLFQSTSERTAIGGSSAETATQRVDDIEHDIAAEIQELHAPTTSRQFTSIKLNVPCVLFIKTNPPIEPVTLVKAICEDASRETIAKRTRYVKRFAPMTLMGRASTEGLEKVAQEVLKPKFHQEPIQPRKFAIRPNLRNHNVLTRDTIIQQIARIVGPGHEVDLKNYDLLIVVEVYQNICGMSVVDGDYERLKRYNIAEIFDPTPKDISGSATNA